ncbi:MAG: NBR1-Ig-like domain-containing protein [Brevefilum sp.]
MKIKQSLKVFYLTFILMFLLSSCNLPWQSSEIAISITSHEEGQTVVLNEETRVVSLTIATRGIQSVELYINGELEHTATPTDGTPDEFTADQPWTPQQEGNVVISVVAIDASGNSSDPTSITVQVVPSVSETNKTPTPNATATPEDYAQTQTAQVGCTNDATFVQDVTIPPDSNLSAGSNFTKIWRVNNSGSCEWLGYELVHASGDLMNASSPKAIPAVQSGDNADLSVNMTAPGTPGTYSASWRIRADDGTVFGPELTLTIIVPAADTATPEPTLTFTPTVTPTQTPTMGLIIPTLPTLIVVPMLSVEQVGEQISIPANSSGNTTVSCPGDSVVVSGGFAGSSGLRIWHSMMNTSENGWRVHGRNTTRSSKSMNVYATCLHNSGGSTSLEFSQKNANANDVTNLKVSCPSGSQVTGGGWVVGSNTSIEIYNSSKSGNGWQIYIDNSAGDTPLVNVYAVCLSGVSGSTSSTSNNGDVPGNDIGHVVKQCPSGQYVTGGGFATNIGAIIYNTSKTDNGWQNYAQNTTGIEKGLNTYTICYEP